MSWLIWPAVLILYAAVMAVGWRGIERVRRDD